MRFAKAFINNFSLLSLLFTATLFASCGGSEAPETPELPEEEEKISVEEGMVGKWVSFETRRSGNPVDDFPDFHVEFKDGIFTSDLIDASAKKPFENGEEVLITGDYISFPNVDNSYFNVETLNDSVLILTTELRDYPFEFEFRKVNE